MSISVRLKGSLRFRNAEVARFAFDYMHFQNEHTAFFVPPERRNEPEFYSAVLEDLTLVFDYENSWTWEVYHESQNIIFNIYGLSLSTMMDFQFSEFRYDGWIEKWMYSYESPEKDLLETEA